MLMRNKGADDKENRGPWGPCGFLASPRWLT